MNENIFYSLQTFAILQNMSSITYISDTPGNRRFMLSVYILGVGFFQGSGRVLFSDAVLSCCMDPCKTFHSSYTVCSPAFVFFFMHCTYLQQIKKNHVRRPDYGEVKASSLGVLEALKALVVTMS